MKQVNEISFFSLVGPNLCDNILADFHQDVRSHERSDFSHVLLEFLAVCQFSINLSREIISYGKSHSLIERFGVLQDHFFCYCYCYILWIGSRAVIEPITWLIDWLQKWLTDRLIKSLIEIFPRTSIKYLGSVRAQRVEFPIRGWWAGIRGHRHLSPPYFHHHQIHQTN